MKEAARTSEALTSVANFLSHHGPVAGFLFALNRLYLSTGKELSPTVIDSCAFSASAIALLSSLYHTANKSDDLSLFQKLLFPLAGMGSMLGSINIASFNPEFAKSVGKNNLTQWLFFTAVATLCVITFSLQLFQKITKSKSSLLAAFVKMLPEIGPFIGFSFTVFLMQFTQLDQKAIDSTQVNAMSITAAALSFIYMGANFLAIKQSENNTVDEAKKFIASPLDVNASTQQKALWYLFLHLDTARFLVSPISDALSIANMLSISPRYNQYFSGDREKEAQRWVIFTLALMGTGCGIHNAVKEVLHRIGFLDRTVRQPIVQQVQPTEVDPLMLSQA